MPRRERSKEELANEAAAAAQLEEIWRTWKDDDLSVPWGWALDRLEQFCDPDGVLALLAYGAPVPDWVRREIAAWRAGERPPLPPPPSDDDERLLAAAADVRDEATWLLDETRGERIKRAIKERGVKGRALSDKDRALSAEDRRKLEEYAAYVALTNFLNTDGRPHARLMTKPKRWDAVYTDGVWEGEASVYRVGEEAKQVADMQKSVKAAASSKPAKPQHKSSKHKPPKP
jgi:hypothetical protein